MPQEALWEVRVRQTVQDPRLRDATETVASALAALKDEPENESARNQKGLPARSAASADAALKDESDRRKRDRAQWGGLIGR